MAKPKKMQGYLAVRLTDEAAHEVRGLAVHPSVHGHHTTLHFTPTEEEYEAAYAALIGQGVRLTVLGMVQDDRGQALAVQLPQGVACKNANPHVTISCAEGTTPKYSNELLANGAPLALVALTELAGTIEFVKF